MRLIDADILQEHFEMAKKESARLLDIAQIIGIQAVIDSQPTVYDVDKVVKQMEEYVKESSNVDYNRAMIEAIEIVKAGHEPAVNEEWKQYIARRFDRVE